MAGTDTDGESKDVPDNEETRSGKEEQHSKTLPKWELDDGAWRTNLDFIAVRFGTMHRRALLRSIRAKVRSPVFQRGIEQILRLTAVDFDHVASVIGELGGVREALASDATHDVT